METPAVALSSSGSVLDATPQSQRIDSLDVVRGLAVLGILLMNIPAMGLPIEAYFDPNCYGGATGWNLRVWYLNELFVEGTMRGLFSMLFGAGVILFTARKEAAGAGLALADSWYRRMIWLVLFGVIHAYLLLWPWDILYSYGLLGMFLFPLRNWPPLRLLAVGLALLLWGSALESLDFGETTSKQFAAAQATAGLARGEILTEEQQANLEAWDERVKEWNEDSTEELEKGVEEMRGGYFTAMMFRAGESWYAESQWHYGTNYFDVLSMMLVGMAFFRWRIFQAQRSWAFYLALAVVGYGIGLPVNLHETGLLLASDFGLVESGQARLTYGLGRVTTTLGHLGLIMLFCKSGELAFLQSALAAVGKLALTNYILQTVITTAIFVGAAQFGLWQRYQLYWLVLAIWILQLILSPLWLGFFQFGPLEWLWRGLTYHRWPEMLRRGEPGD